MVEGLPLSHSTVSLAMCAEEMESAYRPLIGQVALEDQEPEENRMVLPGGVMGLLGEVMGLLGEVMGLLLQVDVVRKQR